MTTTGYLLKDSTGESPIWLRLPGPVRADGKIPSDLEAGLEYFVEVSDTRPEYDSRIQQVVVTRTETPTEGEDIPNQVVVTYAVEPRAAEDVTTAIQQASRAAIDAAIDEDDQMRSLAAAVELLLVMVAGPIVPEMGLTETTQEDRETILKAQLPPLLAKLQTVKAIEAARDAKLAAWSNNGTLPDLDSWA